MSAFWLVIPRSRTRLNMEVSFKSLSHLSYWLRTRYRAHLFSIDPFAINIRWWSWLSSLAMLRWLKVICRVCGLSQSNFISLFKDQYYYLFSRIVREQNKGRVGVNKRKRKKVALSRMRSSHLPRFCGQTNLWPLRANAFHHSHLKWSILLKRKAKLCRHISSFWYGWWERHHNSFILEKKIDAINSLLYCNIGIWISHFIILIHPQIKFLIKRWILLDPFGGFYCQDENFEKFQLGSLFTAICLWTSHSFDMIKTNAFYNLE